jgi:hypothetical protein
MKTCRTCGKKATKDIVYHSNHDDKHNHLFDENLNYLGNDTLINKRTFNNVFIVSYTTWDGSSYKLAYDNFCTLRCANGWANGMINGGYIRVQPMVRNWNWR